jgi:hypothetical protein
MADILIFRLEIFRNPAESEEKADLYVLVSFMHCPEKKNSLNFELPSRWTRFLRRFTANIG